MNDGKKQYNSDKDGQGQEIGSCSVDFRRTDVTAKARLTYFKGKFLELAIHHDKWDEWTTCFVLEGLELPSNPFLGFSAHTGDVSDNHDIISITTSNVDYHPPPASQGKAPPKSRGGGGGGIPGLGFFKFMWKLIKIALVVAVLAAAVVGYRKWQENGKRYRGSKFA